MSYASAVPASRKRKKTGKSRKKPAQVSTRPEAGGVASVFAQLAAQRRDLDARRGSLASEAAESLVTELAALAPTSTDSELQDRLCLRVGPRLAAWGEAPVEDYVAPERFGEALVSAAVAAVAGSLADQPTSDGWRMPWRVLAAVIRVAPWSMREQAVTAVDQLRRLPAGQPHRAGRPGAMGAGRVRQPVRGRFGRVLA